MQQTFILPWPPTANTMWRKWRNRMVASEKYVAWKNVAGTALIVQKAKRIRGPVRVLIELCSPTRAKWDIDNRIKPVLDLLVSHLIIEDDNSQIVREVRAQAVPPGVVGALVTVTPMEAA